MAREFAKSFYKSPAWLKNRKAYMGIPVDLSGNRVYERVADDGTTEYYRDDPSGYQVRVSPESVVPPGMCEMCFARGEYTPAKLVHHIVHVSPDNVDDPHVTLSYDNFQRLCQDCHAVAHHRRRESRMTFDEMGNPVWRETDGQAEG